ncbi:MAG TPA: hypothetical protein VGK99_03960 [Acidobacteriota bacterium]|jgi:hypothetical protein
MRKSGHPLSLSVLKTGESYRADYIAGGKCWRLIVQQENGFVSLTVQALDDPPSRITGQAETVEEGQRKLIEAARAILGPATEEVR